MTAIETHPVPEANWKDKAHAIVRAGLGSIPVVGAAATGLFQVVIGPPLEKRRVEWMNSVAESLKKLEDKGQLRLEDLQSNGAFVDTVMHASQAALRNSQQEKREALRNAVLNAALPSPPDESRQQIFVELIDSFTDWHLRILAVLANPTEWFKENHKPVPELFMTSSLYAVLTNAYPELAKEPELSLQIAKDLDSRGFITTGEINVAMSPSHALAGRGTGLGKDFLKFISIAVWSRFRRRPM